MRRIIGCIITMLAFTIAKGQNFYSDILDTPTIINVGKTDTPFIRVYTKFLVNGKGEVSNISIEKIECSKCDDSLIINARKQSIEFIGNQQYRPAQLEGKSVDVYYTQPILFKF